PGRLQAGRSAAGRVREHSQCVPARLQQPAGRAVAGEAEGVAAGEQVAEPGEEAKALAVHRPELDVEAEHGDDLVAARRADDAAGAKKDDRRLLLDGSNTRRESASGPSRPRAGRRTTAHGTRTAAPPTGVKVRVPVAASARTTVRSRAPTASSAVAPGSSSSRRADSEIGTRGFARCPA